MIFHVGPYTYRLRITAGPLKSTEGETLTGLAVRDDREILISGDVRPEDRLTVLLHELKHAWFFHIPKPVTEEESCELFAMIATGMMNDLNREGGEDRLKALRPPRPHEPAPPRVSAPQRAEEDEPGALRYVPVDPVEEWQTEAPSRAGRAQCGQCDLIVADGSIVTGPAEWSHEAKGLVVRRTLFCSHCYHLQAWVEGANVSGVPNGSVVEGPTYSREGVEEFLSEHPRAVGMIAG